MTPKSFNLKRLLILFTSFFLFNSAPSSQNTTLFDTAEMSSHYGHLKLNISTSSLNYFTEFYFNSNASVGLDPGYDAAIFGGNPPAFSIYSYLVQNSVGTAFAVQTLSHTDMNDVRVSLGVNASQGQQVTFSITQSDVPNSINIYLEDSFNNTSTLINSRDYTFTADTNISGIGRFYLRFEGDALSTTEQTLEGLQIYSDKTQKAIIVNGQLQNETDFRLYDINGRLVNTTSLNAVNTNQSIDTSNFTTGVYILELTNKNSEKRTQKLIIH